MPTDMRDARAGAVVISERGLDRAIEVLRIAWDINPCNDPPSYLAVKEALRSYFEAVDASNDTTLAAANAAEERDERLAAIIVELGHASELTTHRAPQEHINRAIALAEKRAEAEHE